MSKTIRFLVIVGLTAITAIALFMYRPTEEPVVVETQPVVETPDSLSADQAEIVGFSFIQWFIETAPPTASAAAAEKAYAALSVEAKTKVATETMGRDLAALMGVQDVPDQGVSVEDLQMVSEQQATLIVGLNYSGGRVLRAIDMVAEDGEWKVDQIRPIEQYP